jgi:preprotein translocase subunit SecF
MSTDTGTPVSHDELVRLNKSIHTGSFISRLTTGTGAFDIIGKRRYYYMFSTFLVVASILLIVIRGFNLGTDFAGGTTLTFVPSAGAANVSNESVTEVLDNALGAQTVEAVQTLGGSTIQVTLKALTEAQVVVGKAAITKAFDPTGGVSGSNVSSSWGAQISQRAILAVVIFLIAVGLFIWIRYEKRVAAGAVISVMHDLLVTAGVYSLTGFEVTPATVVGLLTILGFSLYDTVVVYDKVQENAKGMLSLLRRTYPETANLAVNQTLMRSLNTSLIAILPVAGLLVAGVAVLGGGTLKDLALVLLVGMLIGAYSSIFVAVPIAVDLKRREPAIIAHTARVLAKRKHDGTIVDADGDPIGRKTLPGEPLKPVTVGITPASVTGLKAGAPPKPGVKPQRPARPTKAVQPKVAPPQKAPAAAPTPTVITPDALAELAATEVEAKATTTPAAPAKSGRPAGKAARPTGKRGR